MVCCLKDILVVVRTSGKERLWEMWGVGEVGV